MKLEQKIIKLCEKNGYKNRGCRFAVISDLMGISPDEAKMVENITRTIRKIFPVDQVGIEKEKEKKEEFGYNTSQQVAIHNQIAHKSVSNCLFPNQSMQ